VRFWDASAVVPLLVLQPATPQLLARAKDDAGMFVWWGTPVECVSAIARLERESPHHRQTASLALQRLAQFAAAWTEIDPGEIVRETAARFLRVHPLRTADALQLAAAFIAAEQRPPLLEIVTLDQRLGEAARKEGFVVLDDAG
jgi:hypothetical protein